MIVRVCQWELNPLTDSVSVPLILSHAKASLFIQSFRDTHLHCMKILAASVYLLHISTPSSSSSTVVFRNVLMWAHFHFGEGLFFFQRSRPQAPCLTPLHSVVCIFELNIKISCLACSFLLLPFFTFSSSSFLSYPVQFAELFPSSSLRCR